MSSDYPTNVNQRRFICCALVSCAVAFVNKQECCKARLCLIGYLSAVFWVPLLSDAVLCFHVMKRQNQVVP